MLNTAILELYSLIIKYDNIKSFGVTTTDAGHPIVEFNYTPRDIKVLKRQTFLINETVAEDIIEFIELHLC